MEIVASCRALLKHYLGQWLSFFFHRKIYSNVFYRYVPGIIYNEGNHYNGSSGRFTAPVSGWYHIQVGVHGDGVAYMEVLVDNMMFHSMIYYVSADNNYDFVDLVQYLAAGQEVYAKKFGGGTVFGSPTLKNTWFAAGLVYGG